MWKYNSGIGEGTTVFQLNKDKLDSLLSYNQFIHEDPKELDIRNIENDCFVFSLDDHEDCETCIIKYYPDDKPSDINIEVSNRWDYLYVGDLKEKTKYVFQYCLLKRKGGSQNYTYTPWSEEIIEETRTCKYS
jgi:hypothetical protein